MLWYIIAPWKIIEWILLCVYCILIFINLFLLFLNSQQQQKFGTNNYYLQIWQMAECRMRHRSPDLHCTLCPPGWGVSRPCSSSTDTLCSPCDLGSYSPHHSYHAPCWTCSHCGPGLYEAHACTSNKDTVCDSCQRLTALNTSNKHCP